jgi:predicted porin
MQSRLFRNIMVTTLFVTIPVALEAQVRGGEQTDRLRLSAWAGGFTSGGGFSQGDDFFQFDDRDSFINDYAFGAALRYAFSGGLSVGVEALFANPDYVRFDRVEGTELSRGEASLYGLMASASMTGAPGRVSFMLSGGVGFFSWDVEELGERNSDIALDFGVGLDYRLNRRLILFGDYTWWWVYHEKDDNIVTNTARMNILRAGLRLVVI